MVLTAATHKEEMTCYDIRMGSTVVHVYNPSYVGGTGRRIMVQGQPQAKI
jgi:hypothetical protein